MIYRLDSSFGGKILPLPLSSGTHFGAARCDATHRLGLRGGCLGRLRRARVASLPVYAGVAPGNRWGWIYATPGVEFPRSERAGLLHSLSALHDAELTTYNATSIPRPPSPFSLSLFPTRPTRSASSGTRSKSQLEILARVPFNSIQHLRAFEDWENFVES